MHLYGFCSPAGDKVLAGGGRQSFHGAAEDGERKHHSGPESPAGAAEHLSLKSQNSKTTQVNLSVCEYYSDVAGFGGSAGNSAILFFLALPRHFYFYTTFCLSLLENSSK